MKQMTKQSIADSFLELSGKMPLNNIKVKDIVSNCNISKQTFYNYFYDKYDLMNYIYESSVEKILESFIDTPGGLENDIQGVFEMCLANKRYYTAIINIEGQNSFHDYFYEHTKRYYIEQIRQKSEKETLTKSIMMAIDFNCSGTRKLFMDWVFHGMKESPKYMMKKITDCMPNELRKFFFDNTEPVLKQQ